MDEMLAGEEERVSNNDIAAGRLAVGMGEVPVPAGEEPRTVLERRRWGRADANSSVFCRSRVWRRLVARQSSSTSVGGGVFIPREPLEISLDW